MARMEGGGGETGKAAGTREAVMLWEFTSLCQAVFHPKVSVLCDAREGEDMEYIRQQTGHTEPHCTKVYGCDIPWSLGF